MKVLEFINIYKESKVQNTQLKPNAISEYIRSKLEVKSYIPFKEKREIVEIVVRKNTEVIDGIKKNDAINQYVGFVIAMLVAHTNLECSEDPVVDYDLLAESGLLPIIITEFKSSYDECDILLKMAVASELEDNNINALVGRFLNNIMQRLDNAGEFVKEKFGDADITKMLGGIFKQEDLTNLKGFLDKYNK